MPVYRGYFPLLLVGLPTPVAFQDRSAVPYGDSFAVVGGGEADGNATDLIYVYNPVRENWFLHGSRLAKKMDRVVAFPVPKGAFPECGKK